MEIELRTNLSPSPRNIDIRGEESKMDLIQKCTQNDRRAQQLVYQMVQGQMLGLCLRYFQNRDDALAVFNNGMLKVFRNISTFNPKLDFEGWVYRIVQRSALDELRSRFRRLKHERNLEETDHAVEFPTALEKLKADDLMALTAKLPPATNAVFHLYVVDGYSHKDISKLLGIEVGTSKWHLSSARSTLKEMIKKHYA